jgi:subtilisin family serine protease
MKKIILLIMVCLPLWAIAQETQTYGTLLKKDGLYYVETDGIAYLADTSVVTVKFKNGVKQTTMAIDTIRANKLGFIDIAVPISISLEDFVVMLKKTEDFEYVDYNSFGELCFSPNDPLLSNQYYPSYVNAFEAWNITTASSSVKVGVLDQGLDWLHPDIGYGSDGYKNVDETLGWNFWDNIYNVNTSYASHGTKVSGVLDTHKLKI